MLNLFKLSGLVGGLAVNEVEAGAEWVVAGEGTATQMLDGVTVDIRGGFITWTLGGMPATGFSPAIVAAAAKLPNGRYEAMGPSFKGNPHMFHADVLYNHQDIDIDPPRDFAGLQRFLKAERMKGIVWHHPDGRTVKVKAEHFGIPWPPVAKSLK